MITGRIKKQHLTGRLKKAIEVINPTLENIEITPSQQEQTFNHSNSDGYDEIKVKAIVGDELNVSPTIQKQEFNGLYEKVNVNGVTNEVDANIIPENIKENVSILGVKGVYLGQKYKPKKISFYQYKGSDLTYELNNLDTSDLTTMESMFAYCNSMKTLGLSNFVTDKVTSLHMAFYQMQLLQSIDINHFNTSKVTRMSSAFSGCSSLTEISLTNIDTSKVTTFASMLSSCSKLVRADLRALTTESCNNVEMMFDGCTSLQYLDIRNMTLSNNLSSYRYLLDRVPTNCEIIVKDEASKSWLKSKFSSYTNIKTVAEYGG